VHRSRGWSREPGRSTLDAPTRSSASATSPASTSVDPANSPRPRIAFLPYASPSVSRRGSSRMAVASCGQTAPSPAFWRRRERLTHQGETVTRKRTTTRLSRRAAPRWRAPFATNGPGTASCQTHIALGTAGPPHSPGSSAADLSSSSSFRPSNQAFYFDYRRRWRLAFSRLTLVLCSYRWAWDSWCRCRPLRRRRCCRRRLSATSASSPVPREPDADRPPHWPPPRKTSWIPARCHSRCSSPPCRWCPSSDVQLLARRILRRPGTGDQAVRPVCTVASASFSFFACGIWIGLCRLSPGLATWDRPFVAPRRFHCCADDDDHGDCDADGARCAGSPSSASAETPLGQLGPLASAPEHKLTVYPDCDLWLVLSSADRVDSARGTVFSSPWTSAPSCTCCNCVAPGSRWRRSLRCTRAATERKIDSLHKYVLSYQRSISHDAKICFPNVALLSRLSEANLTHAWEGNRRCSIKARASAAVQLMLRY